MNSIEMLDTQLKSIGIPIDGVARLGDGSVRIDFRSEATAQQRSTAEALAAGWDWSPRRPRSRGALIADITALTPAERSKLLVALAADWLIAKPRAARDLDIAIDGDETVPGG